tara:strand:- start:1248 stop:1499 length:252 start_codon:yes stop_codon:yes gene_type:complete
MTKNANAYNESSLLINLQDNEPNRNTNWLNKTIDMKCPKCEKELIWGGDNDYEDYDKEGDGIVSNSTCTNDECDVETVIIYTK